MPPRSLLSRAPAAFAVVLWFASTFFFLGDTGKHSDDYGVVMRDPATGAINLSHHPWVRWPYFWRPLHLAHASAINTISWDHPWIGHLELAVAHGLVAWMLMGLLTRLGVRRPISYAAALLFMACPLIAEAVLWTSASCNAISCLFLFRTLELVRRQGAGPPTHIRTLWIALLSFITACWYEPGAAALAAVPFVYLAARARTIEPALARASPWRGALRCTIAAGFGCLLYATLLLITAPPKTRGGSESLVTVANALPAPDGYSPKPRAPLSVTVPTTCSAAASGKAGTPSIHPRVGFLRYSLSSSSRSPASRSREHLGPPPISTHPRLPSPRAPAAGSLSLPARRYSSVPGFRSLPSPTRLLNSALCMCPSSASPSSPRPSPTARPISLRSRHPARAAW